MGSADRMWMQSFDGPRFVKLIAKALGVAADLVQIISIHAASVRVTFRLRDDDALPLQPTLRRLLVERNSNLIALGVEEVLLSDNQLDMHPTQSNRELGHAELVI